MVERTYPNVGVQFLAKNYNLSVQFLADLALQRKLHKQKCGQKVLLKMLFPLYSFKLNVYGNRGGNLCCQTTTGMGSSY